MPKYVTRQLSDTDSIEHIFSMSFRHKWRDKYLRFIGFRTKYRYIPSHQDRIMSRVRLSMFWCPFYMRIRTTEVFRKFIIYSDDAIHMKIFLEYEHLKYSRKKFSSASFVRDMAYKYKIDVDDVLTICREITISTGQSFLDGREVDVE